MTQMRPLVWMLMLVLCGCGPIAEVVVDGSFPQPLVRSAPLSVGVYYSEQFRNFKHEQMEYDKVMYSISTGASQVELFDTLFRALFASAIHIEALPPAADTTGLDAILVPQVEELQFSVPEDTRSHSFEIWIKYSMRLLTPQGEPIHEWTMAAYGKTPVAFMKSQEEALHQATIVALRDAGAHLAADFARDPTLKQWLASSRAAAKK